MHPALFGCVFSVSRMPGSRMTAKSGVPMPETNDAKEKLQQALARLDEVVATRSSRQATLQEEAEASDKTLQAQIDALQQENDGLKAELAEARTAYVALEEVADAVDSRLDTAIGSIRTVMAH